MTDDAPRPAPHIPWIEDEAATGPLAELYDRWKAEHPGRDRMPDIMKCFSHRPDFLADVMSFSYRLHFADGAITRRTKERIATYVSGLNQCLY
jgi:alkylhydroperoxidase family enzyme